MSQVKHIKEVADPKKILVDCTSLIAARVMSSALCHACVIENYSKLKERISYSMTRKGEFLQRTLKLYKTKNIHNFRFYCELQNSDFQNISSIQPGKKMEFHIMYDEDKSICPGELLETEYGFSIEVPNELVTNPRNKYLRENDKLVIQFRYRHYVFSRRLFCQYGIPSKDDEEALSNDLLRLYKSGKFADFFISDEDKKNHAVHKFICMLRSKVISKITDEDVIGVTVEAKSRHIQIVIHYMYGGILPQLSLNDLLKVMFVAEELQVETLLLTIRQVLIEILNKSNAKIIIEAPSSFYMHDVVMHAVQFLPKETEAKRKSRR